MFCLRRLSVQVQGKRRLFLAVLPDLTLSFASAESGTLSSSHSVNAASQAGLVYWRVDMLGRGQGCSAVRLILTHCFLFFRCLAAVPDLEGTRYSQVVLTLLKFWGICTFFLTSLHLQSQLL